MTLLQSENVLTVHNDLKVYFYTYDGVARAVDGVNFDIRQGESLGLVGETGCGKSVTANAIMGLIDPPGKIVSGEIIFQGENLLEKDEKAMQKIRGKNIALIFQDPMSCLNPVFQIGDQMTEAIRIHSKVRAKTAQKMALDMIEQVQIPDPVKIMRRYPHQLSGGMLQRIVIAMALMHHPQLIIADEPTTALDVTIQAQILRLIRELRTRFGASMMLISHDLGVVYRNCDRVCILYAGNVLELCDKDTFFSKPLHPYSRGLLRAIPRIDADREALAVIKGNLPDIKDLAPGCRFAQRCAAASEICRKQRPALSEVDAGQRVACHLLKTQ
jgi:oligopeptide/dipeptide ABC transporter ATP-binding protein